jgi:hypothetical protein
MRMQACATASTRARERDWFGRLRSVGSSLGEAATTAEGVWGFFCMEMRVSVLRAVSQLKFFNEIINLATRSPI